MVRTIANPTRGCGTLSEGKAYVRGVVGSPDGVLPSFVELDPYIPFREMGTDESFTRGYLTHDGVTAQFGLSDITDFVRRYPGDAGDDAAVANMVDRGLYPTHGDAPDFEGQRHVDRIRARMADDTHWGGVTATQQQDLLMRAGKTHYPDPEDYIDEAIDLGISKAIPVSRNQDPPTVMAGVTRCWIVHPDTDVGWAVIGYAYLQEVVYTQPDDSHIPQYIQDYDSAGQLEIVDFEDPPDAAAGPNASVDDFVDDDDGADGSDGDDDGDDGGSDGDDPGGSTAETVVPAEMGRNDAQPAHQAIRDADDITYNDLKYVAAECNLDVGKHPDADALAGALAARGLTPNDVRGMAGDDDAE